MTNPGSPWFRWGIGGMVLAALGGVAHRRAMSVAADACALNQVRAYTVGVARAPVLVDSLASVDPSPACGWLAQLGDDWALLDARGEDLCQGTSLGDQAQVYDAIVHDRAVVGRVDGRLRAVVPVRDGALTVGFLVGRP